MKNSERSSFPIHDETTIGQMGLTKREYFAGLAMQGFLAGYYANPNVDTKYIGAIETEIRPQTADIISWADELLKQLETK